MRASRTFVLNLCPGGNMNVPVRWGVILGGAVAVLTLVFGLVEWHRTYEMSFVFLAIATDRRQ